MDCSYNIAYSDPLGEREDCGKTARFMFTKSERVRGKTVKRRFPRCKRHASQGVQDAARDQGYEVEEL